LLCAKEHLRLLLAEARGLAPALGQHLDAPPHRRALEQLVAPALHVRELLDVHALALGRAQPRHGRHVGDRVLVASQVLRPLQLLVEDAVQAVGLVLVAVHGVLDLLRRVAEEVVRLAEHRADMAHLRHHPLHHLPALAQVLRQEFACLRGEVEQHRARLGERERLAARAVRVDHRRDLVVRRHLEEVRLELVAGADIDRMHVVLEAGLLQHDVDFVSVRRGPGVEVDHSLTSCFPKFSPLRRPMKARGAFSRPSVMLSRYLILPAATQAVSSGSAWAHSSGRTDTMKPCTLMRLTRIEPIAFTPYGSVALYCETSPHTATRENGFMRRRTASMISPPTFSK